MKIPKFAFAVLTLVAAGLTAADVELRDEPRTNTVVENRDLKMYADGGEFSSTPMSGGKIADVESLRQFIWRHWSEKTRGYARLSRSRIDNTVTTHIFIEPDESGVWRLALRGVNASYPCPRCNRWLLTDTLYAASLHWTTTQNQKKLILTAKSGKKIWEL